MKKSTAIFLFMLMFFFVRAQHVENGPEKKQQRFQIGVSYVFMDLDMKVHDMSISSVWQGVDFGTDELTEEEIDEINSLIDRTNTLNGLMLDAGMTLYQNPGSTWVIDGSLMLGIGNSRTKTYNNHTDTSEMVVKSNFSDPCLGLGFNIIHQFNPQWGMLIRPMAVVTFGSSDEIEDNMYPYVANFTETREDKFVTAYERINLMATYTAGKFKIALGPGFYYAQSHHDYKVERINNTNGDILLDEISTDMVPRFFIDGVAAAEWTFYDNLSANIFVGAGKDLAARAGIYYKF